MVELIKITEKDGNNIVSARELYRFLEVKTAFTHWMNRMLEYGFQEGRDFVSFLTESTGGRPSTDYALTLDTAKEISMIQRSEKGKQARQYFIECEKKLKEVFANLSPAEQLLHNAQILVDHEKQLKQHVDEIKTIKQKQEELEKQISEDLVNEKVKRRLAEQEFALWWNRTDNKDLYR